MMIAGSGFGATALGAGRLPLQRPLFEFAQDEGRMAEVGAMRPTGFSSPPAAIEHRMEPPDAAGLAVALGDVFSPRTASAVAAAPTQLRAPLILGSPEFMMR